MWKSGTGPSGTRLFYVEKNVEGESGYGQRPFAKKGRKVFHNNLSTSDIRMWRRFGPAMMLLVISRTVRGDSGLS